MQRLSRVFAVATVGVLLVAGCVHRPPELKMPKTPVVNTDRPGAISR